MNFFIRSSIMENRNLWNRYDADQLHKMEEVANWYKICLDSGKTERECVRISVDMAEKAGFRPLSEYIAENKKPEPGSKIYAVYNEKTLALYHIGKESIEKGMNILGAHIDSPRIDVKQNPLYERNGFAYFDTHYYGGIKKYQWVTVPLSLHGVVVKKDATKIDINIGEKDDDPVFVISDLLIHLAQKQMKKTGTEIVEGEKLDLLVGSRPLDSIRPAKLKDKDSVAIKKNILDILKNKYGIEEEDFLSAELEIVPAGKARDMGLDRSMIISYGQDDRICAFTSLMAILDIETPERTACCLLVDKEEIGSVGASGMHSRFFENTTAEIVSLMGLDSNLALRRTLQNSTMLSSDVSAGYDPLYSEVFDKNNAAFLGEGPVFNKFTGSRGKSGSNDANPEFIARIRRILDEEGIVFQTSELGKVDVGGGGTIAYIMANYGMEVIDCGIAILCMHAPYEVASKADIYEAVRAYTAFLNKMDNTK